jgi:hypothetical protein
MHTTIGACAFHFRVRDGIGWFHAAIVTRERVEGRGPVHWLDAHTLSLVASGRENPAFGEISWDVASLFANAVDVFVEDKAT